MKLIIALVVGVYIGYFFGALMALQKRGGKHDDTK